MNRASIAKNIRKWLLTALLGPALVLSQGDPSAEELLGMDLENLMDIEVYSAGKKIQNLAHAAAAATILNREDIRRSGAASLPEVLRQVPGVQVAHIDANKWSVSIRGAAGRYNANLLVLVDGRSVYTPVFSGVYWEQLNIPLEEIERIEVIRGPGGTLWGSNAVNGVINIITRHALENQGGTLSATYGNLESGRGYAGYAGRLGETLAYRVYGQYFNRANFEQADGSPANDRWDEGRGGFRLDWQPRTRDTVLVEGSLFDGTADDTTYYPDWNTFTYAASHQPARHAGQHLLARWNHAFTNGSASTAQFFFDRRDYNGFALKHRVDTFDFTGDYRFRLGERQDIIAGVGYRHQHDHIGNNSFLSLTPAQDSYETFNTFVQDEITLLPDILHLTLGGKLEHNNFSGFAVQPNARLAFTPTPEHTLWAAVSRAARMPSRTEANQRLAILRTPDLEITLMGNPHQRNEYLLAYELGWRFQATPRLSFDTALFFNDYTGLVGFNNGMPGFAATPVPHLIIPYLYANPGQAQHYGAEIAFAWQATDQWKLFGNYNWLNIEARFRAGSTAFNQTLAYNREHGSPRHRFVLGSQYNPLPNLEWDVYAYYNDNAPAVDWHNMTRLDTRLGWRPHPTVELDLVLQNLLDDRHGEFGDQVYQGMQSTEVPRAVYGRLTWHF